MRTENVPAPLKAGVLSCPSPPPAPLLGRRPLAVAQLMVPPELRAREVARDVLFLPAAARVPGGGGLAPGSPGGVGALCLGPCPVTSAWLPDTGQSGVVHSTGVGRPTHQGSFNPGAGGTDKHFRVCRLHAGS